MKSIETPEGIDLCVSVAGPLPRATAWLLDALIRYGMLFAASFLISLFESAGIGLFLILIFMIEWFYFVLFEVFMHGQTPGKKMIGIQVLNDDGTPVDWGPSLLRNLLRVVDFLPLFYGFGLMSMLANRDFKRIGDIGAGTIVVYVEKTAERNDIPSARPQSPPVQLSLEEQQAVIAYAERYSGLSKERAAELAALATPLAAPLPKTTPQHLLEIANWLVGRR